MTQITYITNSFLDYRIPVFKELDKITDGKLSVVYSKEGVPPRVHDKIENILGERAIGLTGEKVFGIKDPSRDFANKSFRIVFQPGIIASISKTRPDIIIGDGFYQWSWFAVVYRLRYGVVP